MVVEERWNGVARRPLFGINSVVAHSNRSSATTGYWKTLEPYGSLNRVSTVATVSKEAEERGTLGLAGSSTCWTPPSHQLTAATYCCLAVSRTTTHGCQNVVFPEFCSRSLLAGLRDLDDHQQIDARQARESGEACAHNNSSLVACTNCFGQRQVVIHGH